MSLWLGDCGADMTSRPDRVRLYLIWGQSHILGTKSYADGLEHSHWDRFGAPIPGCYIWDKAGRNNRRTLDLIDADRNFEPHSWRPLTAGYGAGGPNYPWEDFGGNPSFGPEMQLAQSLRARTGEGVAIIKLAVGGSQVANLAGIPDWNVTNLGSGNQSLLQILLEGYWQPAREAALEFFEARGQDVTFGGVVSMIGFSDARREMDALAYQQNMLDCIDHIRLTIHSAEPNSVPWLVAQTPDYLGQDGTQLAFIATVRAAQRNIALLRQGLSAEDTVHYRLGGTHFVPNGTAGLGELYYRWAVKQTPLTLAGPGGPPI